MEVETRDDPWDPGGSATEASPRLGALVSDPPAPALASLELVALVVVIGACVVMQGFTATRGAVKYGGADHASFQRLRRRYNIVYTLGTFGDWIQGAYLYALYREHGFDMADIGYIFVLGYFASATVGTYVASLGDVYGHRRLVMLYGTLYGVACVLMRSSDVTALLASRVLSGVAYSLLFSSFESWAISEVDRLRLDRRCLVPLFSTATFFNAVSAVAAGVVGNLAVEYFQPASTQALDVAGRGVVGSNPTDDFATHGHGHRRHALFAFASDAERPAGTLLAPTNKYVPAFDIGAAALLLCALGARSWWAERRPDEHADTRDADARAVESAMEGIAGAPSPTPRGNPVGSEEERGVARVARMVVANPELLGLGVVNSLYEAALHVFVFVWTPALERRGPVSAAAGAVVGRGGDSGGHGGGDGAVSAVPHGLVFSLFMACKMAGSQLYALTGDRVPANVTLRFVFMGAAAAFLVPLLAESYAVALASFCAFEFGLGLYWPAMAVMRAELVPNHLRATMTSVFRVPLNALVMACLAFAGNASEPSFLTMCVVMMTGCLAFTGRRGSGAGVGAKTTSGDR